MSAKPATPGSASKSSERRLELIEERRKDSQGNVHCRHYTKGKLLGKGGFAKCYLAGCHTSKRNYALKVVPKSTLQKERARQKLQCEIKIHRTLHHDRIVKFERFFEDRVNAYMVLELCTNQSMSELVKHRKRLTEPEARFYMLELLDAVEYIHGQFVIHRDLKLGNLFLDEAMSIKVGDFGLAAKVMYPDEKKRTICGTPNYIAPEILKDSHAHSFPVDVWSSGVILYTLLVGKPPFEAKDVKSTYKRILANAYTFPENVVLSEDVKDLIRCMLQSRPERRPSLQEIGAHAFFTTSTHASPAPVPAIGWTVENALLASSPGQASPGRSKAGARYGDENNPFSTITNRQSTVNTIEPVDKQPAQLPPKNASSENAYAGLLLKSKSPQRAESTKSRASSAAPRSAFAEVNNQDAAPTTRGTHSRPGTASGMLTRRRAAMATSASTGPTAGPLPFTIFEDNSRKSRSSITPKKSARGEESSTASNHATPRHPRAAAERSSVRSRSPATSHSTTTASTAAREKRTPSSPSGKKSKLSTPVQTRSPAVKARRPASAGIVPDTKHMTPQDCIRTVRTDRDLGTLETMHQTLSQSFACAAEPSVLAARAAAAKPKVWVTRYVDYTSKYGLGFLLNNGCAGVYFNDSTKIVCSVDNSHFQYIERRKAPRGEKGTEHVCETFTMDTYPEALQKKVTLLKHFRNYLLEQEGQNKVSTDTTTTEGATVSGDHFDEALVYLKKWVRTRHAILFRLSNRTVQVMFFDKSEVLLSSEARALMYVDKTGGRSEHTIDEVLSCGRNDIIKRLKYTKDILYQLINGSPVSSS